MLCCGDNESLSHVQCICPALQDVHIRAHHNLVTLLRGRLGQESQQWAIHSEMSTASLLSMECLLTVITIGSQQWRTSLTYTWT